MFNHCLNLKKHANFASLFSTVKTWFWKLKTSEKPEQRQTGTRASIDQNWNIHWVFSWRLHQFNFRQFNSSSFFHQFNSSHILPQNQWFLKTLVYLSPHQLVPKTSLFWFEVWGQLESKKDYGKEIEKKILWVLQPRLWVFVVALNSVWQFW